MYEKFSVDWIDSLTRTGEIDAEDWPYFVTYGRFSKSEHDEKNEHVYTNTWLKYIAPKNICTKYISKKYVYKTSIYKGEEIADPVRVMLCNCAEKKVLTGFAFIRACMQELRDFTKRLISSNILVSRIDSLK